jgi:hypothetical protein
MPVLRYDGNSMGLKCNIDSRGKRVRLVNGIVTLAIGIAIAGLWGWGSGSVTGWGVGMALMAAGAFMIFEARAGWCVLRAMGIKTRI